MEAGMKVTHVIFDLDGLLLGKQVVVNRPLSDIMHILTNRGFKFFRYGKVIH